MNSIVIVKTDHIGDAILNGGYINEILRKYKNSKVTIVCEEILKDFYVDSNQINVIFFDKKKLLKDPIYFIKFFIKILFLNKNDVLINPMLSRTTLSDFLCWVIRAKHKYGFEKKLSNTSRLNINIFDKLVEINKSIIHELDILHQLYKTFKIERQIKGAFIGQTDIAIVNKSDRKVIKIGISPGRSFEEKHWGDAKYIYLIEKLLEIDDVEIYLLGFPSEVDLILKYLDTERNNIYLSHKIAKDFIGFFNLVGEMDLVIGNDNGVLHGAAAKNIPLLVLHSGGAYGRFFPYFENQNILISIQKCDFYGCNWNCKFGDIRCLNDVRPNHIIQIASAEIFKIKNGV